jgi:putative transcriptional regulator
VRAYDAAKVKALRERLKWEVGDKRPSGPSQKLLDIIDRKGLEAVL